MKKLVSILACTVLLLGTAVGCGNSTSTSGSTAGTTTAAAATGEALDLSGATITLPSEDWISSGASGSYQITNTKEATTVMAINATPTGSATADKATQEAALDASLEGLEASYTDVTTEKGEIDGFPSATITLSSTNGGQTAKGKAVVVVSDKVMFMAIVTAPEGDFKNSEAAFDSMIATLKFA